MSKIEARAMLHPTAAPKSYWQHFVPKSVITLREGYSLSRLGDDALAGITVAILALPLSMAIAIGAGLSPDKGLITSVVAGFVISALGGSRFQVGGPAAAFIVIIGTVNAKHGNDGLLTATFLAGFILLAAGLLRLGSYIRYIPGPVILGFTSGIGFLIALGQLKDFFGLTGTLPLETVHRLEALWSMKATLNPSALALGLATLLAIIGMRAWRPRWPGLLLAVVAASAAAVALGLPIETIGSRFGGIPNALPSPEFPNLGWSKISDVLPSAMTIAFLVGVESLLSAVAADSIAGTRHRSNIEIVAQGAANIVSPMFGGMPATGVIARTGTNIAAGARTPVAGMLHAVFVLLAMLLLAPLASYLALPCLAAVLLHVSWRLLDVSEVSHFLARAPMDDRLILLSTLLLTIFVDLNVAIAVGVVLGAIMFMHRMAETLAIRVDDGAALPSDLDDVLSPKSVALTMELPPGVRVFQLRGPLFFGAATHISDALRELDVWPRVIVLRMREVPLVDATALSALETLMSDCTKNDCRLIISGLQQRPRQAMHRMNLLRRYKVVLTSNSYLAIEKAKALVASNGAASAGT